MTRTIKTELPAKRAVVLNDDAGVVARQVGQTEAGARAGDDGFALTAQGCDVVIAMRNWSGGMSYASRSFRLFYDVNTHEFRASNFDGSGVDGSGGTQHVYGPWDACYFTDSAYSTHNLGDTGVGMHFMYWVGYGAGAKTCHLWIED